MTAPSPGRRCRSVEAHVRECRPGSAGTNVKRALGAPAMTPGGTRRTVMTRRNGADASVPVGVTLSCTSGIAPVTIRRRGVGKRRAAVAAGHQGARRERAEIDVLAIRDNFDAEWHVRRRLPVGVARLDRDQRLRRAVQRQHVGICRNRQRQAHLRRPRQRWRRASSAIVQPAATAAA